MEALPISNPPNPWLSSQVEYLDEIPEQRLEVYVDATRKILATNDSPDVGFKWSINPYRGCSHSCAYCVGAETGILMGDGSTRPIRELGIGDTIIGTQVHGKSRRYVRTEVWAHWSTTKPAHRIRLEDGTALIASADHRFLTTAGWTYVAALSDGDSLIAIRGGDTEIARRVVTVEALGIEMPMFDITTGTGDFIADGVVSHNCYARPSHEYLGFGAGTDFDRKITVKPEAARLLREAFEKKSWAGELVMFSGVTDCYQPLEASYRLTRGCLEVCAEYRNPCGIITKAPLIERDLDLLVELHRVTELSVTISVPFWDPERARAIEPLVATPQRRIRTIEKLAKAGLDVGVNIAPMIPGLGDEDMPKILEAAAGAGATHAGFVFLRLPGSVKQVFEERLRATMPLRADKILSRIREARGGKLYDPRFGVRGKGEGVYAEQAKALFDATCRRVGLNQGCRSETDDARSTFARPPRAGDQLKLL